MSNAKKRSPKPKSKDVFQLVRRDLDARNKLGWKQHHRPLLTTTPMDSLAEAYAESLDLTVYLRKELYKRDGR